MEEIKNVYDNEEFFNSYAQLRKNENSHNTVIEQPTMRALLPDVKGMRVLELGCGSGANAFAFAEGGAVQVVAIDLSEKMLSVAKEENSHPCVQYLQMDMAQIGAPYRKLDWVVRLRFIHLQITKARIVFSDTANLLFCLFQIVIKVIQGENIDIYAKLHAVVRVVDFFQSRRHITKLCEGVCILTVSFKGKQPVLVIILE